MRTLSFMVALAFVVAGASIAGSSDTALPGVGTLRIAARRSPLQPLKISLLRPVEAQLS